MTVISPVNLSTTYQTTTKDPTQPASYLRSREQQQVEREAASTHPRIVLHGLEHSRRRISRFFHHVATQWCTFSTFTYQFSNSSKLKQQTRIRMPQRSAFSRSSALSLSLSLSSLLISWRSTYPLPPLVPASHGAQTMIHQTKPAWCFPETRTTVPSGKYKTENTSTVNAVKKHLIFKQEGGWSWCWYWYRS